MDVHLAGSYKYLVQRQGPGNFLTPNPNLGCQHGTIHIDEPRKAVLYRGARKGSSRSKIAP